MYFKWLAWPTICVVLSLSMIYACNRKPLGATGDRSPVDDSFQIYIEGNPPSYAAGQHYNISLSCAMGSKFISFTLIVESEDGASASNDVDMLGHFEIIDKAETKFSADCENMIESTNANAKTRVDVAWIAPKNLASGCLLIRAAVLQHRNVWYIDDGFLTKRLCPEENDEINTLTRPVNPCCACDEAKYEILLERIWTRNTHAQDFPADPIRTRFSELIGASHKYKYRFWEYGELASPGVKLLAEHGSTSKLEAEIKHNSSAGHIRTIIRAPGIPFRFNTLSTTMATARVDAEHHIISLVTKIFPSPDWILGVAGLELCMSNCTWIDRKVLNLYPWDVGTDAGPSYESPDQPQIPADVIRRITSTLPNDPRSPFYDGSGAPMKPLARLHITRRKLYQRECETAENVPLECATHPWNNWSECSTRCGPGDQQRYRAYKDVRLAASYNCNVKLNDTQNCMGNMCGATAEDGDAAEDPRLSAECELTYWGAWSKCSKRCGTGFKTRRREFKNPLAGDRCQSGFDIELEQKEECLGEYCGGSISNNYFDSRRGNIYDPPNANQNEYNAPADNTWPTNYGSTTNAYEIESMPGERNYGNERQMNVPPNERDQQRYVNGRQNNRYVQTAFPNRARNDDTSDIVEQYDNYGRKIVAVAGSNTNNYAVLQEYCLEKPYPPEAPCKAKPLVVKNYWFYDADSRSCKLFTADNCDDNKNRFGTLKACEGTCQKPQQILDDSQGNLERPDQNGFGEPQSQIKDNWRRKNDGMTMRKNVNFMPSKGRYAEREGFSTSRYQLSEPVPRIRDDWQYEPRLKDESFDFGEIRGVEKADWKRKGYGTARKPSYDLYRA